MKKRFFIMLCAFFAAICILILPISASSAAGADKIYTLFACEGAFIVENPIDTSDKDSKPWLLIGKDVFMTDNGGYPAEFDNENDTCSCYYLAGSNSIEWLAENKSYTDRLNTDYVVEYTVKYGAGAEAYASVCLAYNYDYYIEVYISPSGCGDILIVCGESSVSMLDSSSILDSDNPEPLIAALGGEGGALPERLAVSIKAELDGKRMPKRLEVYINGLLVGTTSACFGESVENLTPVYNENVGAGFPEDKLGNIIALKLAAASYGEIQNIYIYSSAEDTPGIEAQRFYADNYGNASFDFEAYNNAANVPKGDTDDNIIDYDAITTLAVAFGIADAAIIVIALVILIIRKKDK